MARSGPWWSRDISTTVILYNLHTTCTVCSFRIYDPRASSAPVREGGNVIPKKGSRLVWTNDNLHLLVTGFTKQSERLVNLYTSQDLKQVH